MLMRACYQKWSGPGIEPGAWSVLIHRLTSYTIEGVRKQQAQPMPLYACVCLGVADWQLLLSILGMLENIWTTPI